MTKLKNWQNLNKLRIYRMSISTGSIFLDARYSMDGGAFARLVSRGGMCLSFAMTQFCRVLPGLD